MKRSNLLQYTALAAISMSLIAGCASTPAPEAETQAAPVVESVDAAAAERARAEAEARAQAEARAKAEAAAREQAELERQRAAAEAARRAEMEAARMTYGVVRGDSLWKISGKAEVYADPYRWPLIYKRNHDQIKDADLIYPGQVLKIDRAPSAADVDAAVQHARTRGAWSIGPVEDSDRAYLSR